MLSAVSSTCTYPKCLKTTAVGCHGTCSQSYGLEGIIPKPRADLAPDPALFAEVVEALRGMVANACAAAKIKGNMMIIICTNEEWESHVAATEAATTILAKLDAKEASNGR